MDNQQGSKCEEALQLLDEMNRALADLLPDPSTPLPTVSVGDDKIQGAADAFASALGKLEKMITTQQSQQMSPKEQLEQEILELQEQLQSKDQLLQKCQDKVQQWQRTCDELRDLHQQNLFKGISQEQ